ncbi:MAG TPA: dTDP-4-dehydrorhamnose 3,5-epimerase [Burkholderiales bacterium]|nr:dTDP-4-dehydrorhamnose 3,5-epimerase [Burkholderiales bacterium]
MKVVRTDIPDVMLLEPKVFEDQRGLLWESYNRRAFADATGVDVEFVQDNHSRSRQNVLRGLHYQVASPQGKLVRVLRGEIFDVAVDLRKSSPTFGRWVGFTLSDRGSGMAWIPPGFAHGLYAVTDVDVMYKMTTLYSPAHERTIVWDDPDIAIRWPTQAPILSDKDKAGKHLKDAEVLP